MASTTIGVLSPPLFLQERRTHFVTFKKFPVSTIGVFRVRERRLFSISAKATGKSSETFTSIVESVQNIWESSEDRPALVGLGFTAIVALWASTNLVVAIDKLPVIPSTFELIGILYSSWFVYRYLLFKPDREELFQSINKSLSDILGQ
ncbi:hypothetical protein GIB67_017297 [Kingdonia uniflora]|uniref:Cyanobacterial aminoacyl-tRNA synthetase CAAD domain-containing protein n=1 Tax=Kingdonia uniflora TaxID=39325 RepID=A0A7J7N384_9MAGN|nr:hypothetical protein GIB67_017297 [Kingdonia uniflora]